MNKDTNIQYEDLKEANKIIARLNLELNQWKECATRLKQALNLFNCEGYPYKEEVMYEIANYNQLKQGEGK